MVKLDIEAERERHAAFEEWLATGPTGDDEGEWSTRFIWNAGWQARAAQPAAPVATAPALDVVAGVDMKRLLRNLEETSYNEGSEALACRLSDTHAVIKALMARITGEGEA